MAGEKKDFSMQANLDRYYYYIANGTDDSMIAPLQDEEFKKIVRFLRVKFNINEHLTEGVFIQLRNEIRNDYSLSMRKSIVDYVLMNENERKRLNIEWTPKKFELKWFIPNKKIF